MNPVDPIESATPLAPVNILLVDDEVRNLDVLDAILYSPEYRLVRASTAEEALMLLLEGEFAVIVLDVQMPGMNGIELANLIKQRKRTQHIPIIFLTAYFQEEKDALEGYGSGGADYLTKPINPQILKSKIAVFVDLFRKTRALAAVNLVLEQEVAQRKRAEEALRQSNLELELRVHERTAELWRANQELQARERELQASATQLRLVTDHAPVYLVQCDREHRITFVNRPYAERFGLEPADVLGQRVPEILGEEAYVLLRPYLDMALEGQRVEFELEMPYPNRAPRWVYAVHVPERSPEGDVIGLVAVVADITERKLAEQEMALARDRALAASRAKDEFLARLSHELRTPLNPVLLLASDAANNPQLPEAVRADFQMIAANVSLEARLIDDLLDLTRIARGKLALELRPFDLHPILRGTFAMVEAEAAAKGVAMTLRCEAEQTMVLGDEVRLKQIFWNLLQNAIKFTPPGGRVAMDTQVVAGEAKLKVRVADTGIGMKPAELARVFEAFEQGDHAGNGSAHRYGGLGLGLSISRMLVEMHSGCIRAESTGPGKGTVFEVELPLQATPTEVPASEGSQPPLACALPLRAQAAAERAHCILLVEDHTPTRLALANLLVRRGCKVVTAGDAASARALILTGQFDLLISDIGLPDGTGYELMAEFRERYEIRGIALTGYGSKEDVTRSELAGFSTHLTKPVSMQALDAALAAVLPKSLA
jgi:PAS domain S-box-containing protein